MHPQIRPAAPATNSAKHSYLLPTQTPLFEIRELASQAFANAVKQGQTAHFQVFYDSSLAAQNQTVANSVLAYCERGYNTISGNFSGILPPGLPFLVLLQPIRTGEVYHFGCDGVELFCDVRTSPAVDPAYSQFLVAVEVFATAQGLGWDCATSLGEALSRVLAAKLYPEQVPTFAIATWLDSRDRPDYVNATGSATDARVIACAVLFLNYLRFYLGYYRNMIVAAEAPTLAQIAAWLTSGTYDAFFRFLRLMDDLFQVGRPCGLITDNPFVQDWAGRVASLANPSLPVVSRMAPTSPSILLQQLPPSICASTMSCASPTTYPPEHVLKSTPSLAPPSDPSEKIDLTIGMATYNDFDGVYFTLQALRLYQDLSHTELLIVDNYGCENTRNLVQQWSNARYISATEVRGTAFPRDSVFREARGKAVLCCDSHILFPPGVIAQLKQFYREHPACHDLLQGPLIYDDGTQIATHLDPCWRNQMWGIWAYDPRGEDPQGEPFKIPMQGLGIFSCLKSAWPGFHPEFRGFGGEEGYIHEKFRQAVHRCLCLPWFRWMHRFSRPSQMRYTITVEEKLRNYVIGYAELGLDLDPVQQHFRAYLPMERVLAITEQALGAPALLPHSV